MTPEFPKPPSDEVVPGDIETFCDDGVWKNRIHGSEGAEWTYATRAEAVFSGRETAITLRVGHVIREPDD
jgi:hypothetical protein